ncbi:uncharacterized protein KY384_001563 [Bacidia gigantensis]|uniref:uncharacterized protein n=1 Tax=Bacidia gigantensis TaxID=2732470 RepID=UPI001D04D00C|nr:uncharacterized protein KY384_001563 [Bacidia gigantensis]KAG8533822.1 hypothetical protein KY384_001563 [Bacidia gigantensis]
MVKPLLFKGEKKSRKRKAPSTETRNDPADVKALAMPSHQIDVPEADGWVSAEAATDVSGPIIFVLPSSPPYCIACDANGKVFTSELENLVEGDPNSAEPHDVRQVWIASKVAGTEEFSFKGHHGRYSNSMPFLGYEILTMYRYLSCDETGSLSANREAISPEESFRCIPSPKVPCAFSVQTVRDTFLNALDEVKGLEVRGDTESVSFKSTLRIRMQARFKPKNKAHKEQKVKERISRKELEGAVGRHLEDDEVRRLKKARMQGDFHEAILDVRVKGKHDKFG